MKIKEGLLPVLGACLGATLIGLSPIFVRHLTVGPSAIGFYRLLIALPFIALWMNLEKKNSEPKKVTFKAHLLMALAGFFLAFDLVVWHASIHLTSVANATLFNNMGAFFIPLIAWFLFGERPTKRFMLAIGFAFIGLISLMRDGVHLAFNSGDWLALLSAVAVGGYMITVKKLRFTYSTGCILFWSGFSTMTLLGLLAFLSNEQIAPQNFREIGLLISIALIVHVLGQGLAALSLAHVKTGIAAMTMLFSPIMATFVAWLLFNETLSLEKMGGGLLILLSLVIATWRPKALPLAELPTPPQMESLDPQGR